MDNKILEHYQNWLREYQAESSTAEQVQDPRLEQIEEQNQENVINDEPSAAHSNQNEEFFQFPIDSHSAIKVFDNEEIEVFVKKSFHQRQKKFRLQDNLFHVKIKTKDSSKQPLLFDLLDVLYRVFSFILSHIQTFFDPNDINEVYVTLFQEPMLNGLNSPAIRLQDDPHDVVQRILDMLFRFLISDSNINLELNDTFIVYVHVLSIDHVNFKKNNPKAKVTNSRRKHFGTYKNKNNTYTWAIDIPNGYGEFPNVFKNECFLISVILGHFQNEYHKTNRLDKRIIYAQNINSKCKTKQIYGGKILLKELQLLKQHLKLTSGPYDVESVAMVLSDFYKCQIFIFSGEGKATILKYSYPTLLNDSLEPIFLYETESDHVIFIRQINVFFLKNQKICIYCRRKYKTARFLHRCDM
jgi:hypothetical protein